jgi:hypothetical protein
MSNLKDAYGWRRSGGPPGPQASATVGREGSPPRWLRVGQWPQIVAAIVGVPVFLLLMVGTQAARSTIEAFLGMVVATLTPVPMLALGATIRKRLPFAKVAAIAYPVVLGLAQLALKFLPPPRRDGPLYDLCYNFIAGQLYYLPFAGILALIVVACIVDDRHEAI